MTDTPASNRAILDQQANYGGDSEMPRYRSTKIVHAFEIKTISRADEEITRGVRVWPADDGYGPIYLSSDTFTRWMPGPGDFIVHYADGYWSASPRKAFIEGHTPLNRAALANVARWNADAATPLPVLNASPGVDSAPTGLRHLPAELKQQLQDDVAARAPAMELRRWAIEQANDFVRFTAVGIDTVALAAKFEAYVLSGKITDKPASGEPLPEEPNGLRRGAQVGRGADVQRHADVEPYPRDSKGSPDVWR